MPTNVVTTTDDPDMADCDGEKVVTMMDVLQEQQEFEENANAVLGASDDKECTYSKGYIKRQAIYACLTCCSEARNDPTKRAGVCLACSLNCHENHELIELYTKRNFRCDCGNPKFNSHPCTYTPNKTDMNDDNIYNQNFSGLYCVCHRPYPDPESILEDDMVQCIICEDWLHASHLEATLPGSDQCSDMVCKACMEKNEFLHDYSELALNVENNDVDVITVNGNALDTSHNGCNGNSGQFKNNNIVENTSTSSHSSIESETNTDQNDDMTKKPNEIPTKNTDTTLSYEENKQELTDVGINENTNSIHEDISETEDKTTASVDSSDVAMDCDQADKNETLPQGTGRATDLLEDANMEEPVASSEEFNKKVETTVDETDEAKVFENTAENPGGAQDQNDDDKISNNTKDEVLIEKTDITCSEKNTNNKINEGESQLFTTTNEETIEKKVTIDSTDTESSVQVKDSEDENNLLELDDTQQSKENKIQESDVHFENSDKLQENNIFVTESEKTSANKVDEQTNDAIEKSITDSNPNIESKKQVTEEHQKEAIDESDTLEAATKELSDIMEDSNQETVTEPIENLLKNDVSSNYINDTKLNEESVTVQINIQNDSDSNKIYQRETGTKNENVLKHQTVEPKEIINETDQTGDVFNALESENKSLEPKNTENNIDPADDEEKSSSESAPQITDDISNDNQAESHNSSSDNESKSPTDDVENEHKRKCEDNTLQRHVKKPKLDDGNNCVRPKGVKQVYKGATFWPSHFRQKLCTCYDCLRMYKDLNVLFIVDPDDSVSAYVTLGREITDRTPSTQYEKGLEALATLDRIQQINALTEYNKMRDKLLDFLKSFKDRKEIVKEEDIKEFFAGMKPKREPDGIYFCK